MHNRYDYAEFLPFDTDISPSPLTVFPRVATAQQRGWICAGNPMTQKSDQYTISLSDCLEDIASNFIYAEIEYSDVPPFVLIPIMFEAVNDLIDEFSTSPEK
jgi:hypothetical protein